MTLAQFSTFTLWATMIAIFAYVIISVWDVKQSPRYKWMVRALTTFMYLCITGIYVASLLGHASTLIRSGILTRASIFIIAILSIVEILIVRSNSVRQGNRINTMTTEIRRLEDQAEKDKENAKIKGFDNG